MPFSSSLSSFTLLFTLSPRNSLQDGAAPLHGGRFPPPEQYRGGIRPVMPSWLLQTPGMCWMSYANSVVSDAIFVMIVFQNASWDAVQGQETRLLPVGRGCCRMFRTESLFPFIKVLHTYCSANFLLHILSVNLFTRYVYFSLSLFIHLKRDSFNASFNFVLPVICLHD